MTKDTEKHVITPSDVAGYTITAKQASNVGIATIAAADITANEVQQIRVLTLEDPITILTSGGETAEIPAGTKLRVSETVLLR